MKLSSSKKGAEAHIKARLKHEAYKLYIFVALVSAEASLITAS